VARNLSVVSTILVAAHVTLLFFDPRALFPSNLFLLVYPLLVVSACLLGAHTESPEARPLWLLFGCGLLVAAVGELGLTYNDFGTAHTSGRPLYGGTGLGLAVSKTIVTLMGGAIGLKSMPGEGTTITFVAYFNLSPVSQAATPISSLEGLQRIPDPG